MGKKGKVGRFQSYTGGSPNFDERTGKRKGDGIMGHLGDYYQKNPHKLAEMGLKPVTKPKLVSKPMGKPKPMEQTPTGMANSTKGSPYLPPTRPNRKPKL